MVGDFTTPDIRAVLSVIQSNLAHISSLQTAWANLFSTITGVLSRFLGQSKVKSKLSCITGYDTSNAFFEAFLDSSMTYSVHLWDQSSDGGPRGDLDNNSPLSSPRMTTEESINAAAMRKLDHMLRSARVQPGDRILEFGSGWGSMAIRAAQLGCRIDTLTLSAEQKKLADARIAAAGFSEDQVRVHLLDYRDLAASFPALAHCFDAFVCSEMVEHVGARHHAEFFRVVDWALRPRGAGMCIVATTQPECRYSAYQGECFIRRYQWPNTLCPSATSLALAVQAAVPGRFVLNSVLDLGPHYPRTLREWGRRLEKGWTPGLVARIQEEQPHLRDEQALAAFRRKWEYTFAYAEVGYARSYTSCHCWTFVRPVS